MTNMLAVNWSVIAAAIVVSATLVGLAIGVIRMLPTGAESNALLRDLNTDMQSKITQLERDLVTQSETISHQEDTIHQRDRLVAKLEERPSLEQLLSVIESHSAMHLENSRKLDELLSRSHERRKDDP